MMMMMMMMIMIMIIIIIITSVKGLPLGNLNLNMKRNRKKSHNMLHTSSPICDVSNLTWFVILPYTNKEASKTMKVKSID